MTHTIADQKVPPDQTTAHESVPDELRVGRFSRGLEAVAATPEKLHRGRFSEGLERTPQTARKRRLGRFSDGVDRHLPDSAPEDRRGSFADGQAGAVAPDRARR